MAIEDHGPDRDVFRKNQPLIAFFLGMEANGFRWRGKKNEGTALLIQRVGRCRTVVERHGRRIGSTEPVSLEHVQPAVQGFGSARLCLFHGGSIDRLDLTIGKRNEQRQSILVLPVDVSVIRLIVIG